MKKITRLFTVIAGMCVMLTGCGKADSSFSSDYVTSVLDASYKADFDYYVYMSDSDETAAQEMYDGTVSYYADSIAYYCEVDLERADQEIYDEYIAFTEELLQKAKYTVSSAESGNDSCYVTVSIKPINILAQMETGIQTCIDEYNAAVEAAGEETIQNMTDEEYAEFEQQLENNYALSVLEALKTCSENLEYKDSVDFTIQIVIDDQGLYSPKNEDDWNTIDDYVMGLY